MNTYLNDWDAVNSKLLHLHIPCQEFPPKGGEFDDQAIPTILIR